MTNETVSATSNQQTRRPTLLGRSFVHPLFDYALIGGGLSLAFIPFVYYSGLGVESGTLSGMLPAIILLSNSSHFAASTVRLYTKEGTRQALPFLTMGLPLVTVALLSLCVFGADLVGRYIQLIYLTWSPFHYAAQAYGVAVVYAYLAGCSLELRQKRLLWALTILPFVLVVLHTLDKHVLAWMLPVAPQLASLPQSWGFQALVQAVSVLALAAPPVCYFALRRFGNAPLPLISLLAIMANAAWFVLFPLIEGFVWVTVFHGVQYLALVMIFHVRDRMAHPQNRHGRMWHAATFYLACVVLGYGLFSCWPWFYRLFGFTSTESTLMVVAAINIHHFIVDAYIWKLKPGDSNRRIVDTPAVAAA